MARAWGGVMEQLLTRSLARSNNFVTREFAEELIVVRVVRDATDMDSIYVLNDVGTYLWQNLDSKTVDELAIMACEEFEVDLDVARVDVSAFVEELVTLRALSYRDGGTA